MITAVVLSLFVAATPTEVAPRSADPSLVLIVASNRGTRGARPALQYADDDAAKYHEVFASIAGEENTVLLTDFDRDTARLFPALLDKARSPTRAQVDLAVARLSRKAAELARAGRPVRFHFVFAGHGDVDQGRGFLELADGPFTAEDLQGMLATIGAAESHVILDSCNSFFVVNPRRPGGTRFATPRDAVEALARRLPNVGVFLSTSAQAEVYEWSELQSGVFSHAVRSGLMGGADVNRDGNISYEELAAFVETAAADIKNPLYRPTVYARGPNGEDARPILVVPRTAHAALVVDDGGPVRLAARDADGLRWVDLHKDAGAAVTLWFPPSVGVRLEIDRLKPGAAGPVVDATFSLPSSAGEPASLSRLAAAPPAVAMRGAGEIFQALFNRPFGESAFAAWVSRRDADAAPPLAVNAAALAASSASAAAPAVARAPDGDGALPAPSDGFFAVLRLGATIPWVQAGGWTFHGFESGIAAPGVSAAAGRQLTSWLAAELEGGYQRPDGSGGFWYPATGYPGAYVEDTSFRFDLATATVNLRAQVPSARARPYLLLGGGAAYVRVTADPPDFNATLRVARYTPCAQAGAGVIADVNERLFLGVEGRFFVTREVQVLGGRVGFSGASAALLLGTRL